MKLSIFNSFSLLICSGICSAMIQTNPSLLIYSNNPQQSLLLTRDDHIDETIKSIMNTSSELSELVIHRSLLKAIPKYTLTSRLMIPNNINQDEQQQESIKEFIFKKVTVKENLSYIWKDNQWNKVDNVEKLIPYEWQEGTGWRINTKHQTDYVHVILNSEPLDKSLINDSVSYDNNTLLLFKIAYGQTDEVKYLINNGASISKKNDFEFSPLLVSVIYGYYPLVEYFLNLNCDINERTKNGETPLIMAVKHNHMAITGLLINRGADLDAANKQNWRALHFAIKNHNTQIKNLLFSHEASIKTPDHKPSFLLTATICGDIDLTKYLIAKELNISQPIDTNKNTVLHVLSLLDKKDMINILTHNNLDSKQLKTIVNAKTSKYQFPSLSAIDWLKYQEENLKKFKLINQLFELSFNASIDWSQYLEPETKNINQLKNQNLKQYKELWIRKFTKGTTPAIVAASMNNFNLVDLLISKGADITAINEFGESVLIFACMYGKLNYIKNIINYMQENELLVTTDKQITAKVPTLKQYINSTGKSGLTPLMTASFFGHLNLVKYLLSIGANVNKIAEDGYSAYKLAAKRGNWDIVYILSINNPKIEGFLSKETSPNSIALPYFEPFTPSYKDTKHSTVNDINDLDSLFFS